MRLDQWLWAVRLYKSRGLAAEAIRGGRVKLNGAATKAAKEAKPGELVAATVGHMVRTVKILGAPRSRVGAKLVPEYVEDLTPPEEFERVRQLRAAPGAREAGEGRPTKRDRRAIDELTALEEPEAPWSVEWHIAGSSTTDSPAAADSSEP